MSSGISRYSYWRRLVLHQGFLGTLIDLYCCNTGLDNRLKVIPRTTYLLRLWVHQGIPGTPKDLDCCYTRDSLVHLLDYIVVTSRIPWYTYCLKPRGTTSSYVFPDTPFIFIVVTPGIPCYWTPFDLYYCYTCRYNRLRVIRRYIYGLRLLLHHSKVHLLNLIVVTSRIFWYTYWLRLLLHHSLIHLFFKIVVTPEIIRSPVHLVSLVLRTPTWPNDLNCCYISHRYTYWFRLLLHHSLIHLLT